MLKTTILPFILHIFEHSLVFQAPWLMIMNKLINWFPLLLQRNSLHCCITLLAPYTSYGKSHTARLKKLLVIALLVDPYLWPITQGIKPRGLQPNELWQTDVTQCPELPPFYFLHVCIDTNSSFIWATPLCREATQHVIPYLYF